MLRSEPHSLEVTGGLPVAPGPYRWHAIPSRSDLVHLGVEGGEPPPSLPPTTPKSSSAREPG